MEYFQISFFGDLLDEFDPCHQVFLTEKFFLVGIFFLNEFFFVNRLKINKLNQVNSFRHAVDLRNNIFFFRGKDCFAQVFVKSDSFDIIKIFEEIGFFTFVVVIFSQGF